MDQAHKLRNMVRQQNKDRKACRVITVTSGKGGVGKSNVSVNLAIALSRLNHRVIILDADFGLANVEVMLGIRPQHNLADMMVRGLSPQDIVAKGPENIGFISGGSGIREMTNLNHSQIQTLLHRMGEFDELADIVIIDTGAGISASVTDLLLASTEVLLVATPEPTSITDAYALLKTLSYHPQFTESGAKVWMIANRAKDYREGKELFEKLDTVVKKFLHLDMEYLGYIPYDEKLQKAIMKQQPVSVAYPNSPSSRAILELAMILDNKECRRHFSADTGLSGLFAKMFS